jgi:murein L,D-transpeptidase YcbB/YkuD
MLAACGAEPILDAGAADRKPDAISIAVPHGDTALGRRLGSAPGLMVAGERLNAGLLRRFYARHGFAPVWTSRPGQAKALIDALSRAGEHGLDPALFHAGPLRHREALPPLDREILLSDAVLSYADALARGAVPVERRRDDQALTPGPVDVTVALDVAMASADPAASIEALAPATPAYHALRQALRTYRARARAGDRRAASRVRTIEVNLERQRWLPSLPADRVWVNVADQRLVLYRADRAVFSTRIVVGQEAPDKQSPEFRATIDASFYNPPWVIPSDIAAAEVLPRARRDPGYLARNDMVLLENGDVEQRAGPNAGLGLIMFDMPNRFDVYLHDTPNKSIFNRDNRRISHGCIRVQNPFAFAALLMRQPIDVIDQGIAMGTTTRNDLPVPVPVFVVYQTAFVDADGTIQFRPDFYRRDVGIWEKMQKKPIR